MVAEYTGGQITRYRAEYFHQDHLGNTRLGFSDFNQNGRIDLEEEDPATPLNEFEVTQESHYYPFGMNHDGPWYATVAPENKYLYNGKELNTDYDIKLMDYGARWYDGAIGRFTGVDPIAEDFPWVTVYNYAENEPVGSIDLWGLQRVKVNGNYLRKERNTARRKMAEGGAFLRFPGRARRVGAFKSGSTNLTSVSARTSRHLAEDNNMSIDIGSERNALRHVFWSAKMTQEFGIAGANEIGKAHEGIGPYADVEAIYDEPFQGSESGADSTVDLLNNFIGQSIGEANQDATNFELGEAVLNEFRENGFFVVAKDEDGNLSITKQKITQEQYQAALKILRQLDQYGFSEDERN